MDDSLKLSYDMLFENGLERDKDAPDSSEEPQTVSFEEMQQLLKEKDCQWQKQLRQECIRAEEAGFEKGFAAGKDEAEREYLKQLLGFEEMIKQMDVEYKKTMEELKSHIVNLVFDITEKVLDIPFKHAKLQERVQEEVSQIIDKLDDTLQIKVNLSESDFKKMQETFEEKKKMTHINPLIDENLNMGEYVVETKNEYITKKFKKMIADFKESVSFTDIEPLQLDS
jgi:flagellar biosynthesis/type III secretory pathway protein FliH